MYSVYSMDCSKQKFWYDVPNVSLLALALFNCTTNHSLKQLYIKNFFFLVRPNEPKLTSPTAFFQGKPTTLHCLSEGGYPQQSVEWYRSTVSGGTRLAGDISFHTTNDLYSVTNILTFTPTRADDGIHLICQSSYSDEPRLIEEAHTVIRLASEFSV